MSRDLIQLRKAAEQIAMAAGKSTLPYFRKSFELAYKDDDSPVTTADREAEEVVREAVAREFSDHGIIGEEYGSEGEDREVVWVVDPIDGTRSFIHGIPFYTTLIGILINGEPQIGIVYAPALSELLSAARGSGARLNGEACQARTCESLGEATFLTTDIEHIRKHGFDKPFEELLGRTRLHRTWGDAYGHLMVATGRADIMFDPILSIWDSAALLPVVIEAGGSFSDVRGVETIESGNAISCSQGVKDEVLSLFKSSQD